jgi:hypothetical protein
MSERLELLGWIDRRPKIIFDNQHKIALLWSAKSACTTIVKWIFLHNGMLEEALAYDDWIHEYKDNVYQNSDYYRKGLKIFAKGGYTVVKVVRNPFDRAVSSYIAALGTGTEDGKLSSLLDRKIDSKRNSKEFSYSFREFSWHLQEEVDNLMCCVHNLRQRHQIEKNSKLHIDYLIRLEDGLFDGLNRIEQNLNLHRTDFNNQSLFCSEHHTKRISTDRFNGDERFVRAKSDFPIYQEFYDGEIQNTIVGTYEEDFIRYGYSQTL